mgnify:CR=1 FL=1
MYNFYVLDGKKLIDYKPKREHYARALERITDANGSYDLERLWQERPDQFKQILYLSIKFIEHVFDNNSDCSQEETQSWFFIVEFINQMVAKITPRQFMEIFPIAKDYDVKNMGVKIISTPKIIWHVWDMMHLSERKKPASFYWSTGILTLWNTQFIGWESSIRCTV